MSVKLYDDHPPRCEYCLHVRSADGRLVCVRRRAEAVRPCSGFAYDPLKRVPRQEARLPEYRPEDFAIDLRGDEEPENGEEESWRYEGQ